MSVSVPIVDSVTESPASVRSRRPLVGHPISGIESRRWRGRGRSDGCGGSGAVEGTFGHSQRLFARRSDSPAFGGGSVLEVVEDYDRDTYRTVYTVHFSEAVYVLHLFQKKAKHGIATPKRDLELIRTRLQEATRLHAEHEGA